MYRKRCIYVLWQGRVPDYLCTADNFYALFDSGEEAIAEARSLSKIVVVVELGVRLSGKPDWSSEGWIVYRRIGGRETFLPGGYSNKNYGHIFELEAENGER